MSELQMLIAQRDNLLTRIKEIETTCEGIENKKNAERVENLNFEQAKLTAQKEEVLDRLNMIEDNLSSINVEITHLSGSGIDRIFEAIKNQRWYFFKNKTKVIMDKNTGLLWANLDYFPWCKDGNPSIHYDLSGAESAVHSFDGGGINGWIIPDFDDFKEMISDKSFPYQEGNDYYIKHQMYWYCDMTGRVGDGIDLADLTTESGVYFVIPCSKCLVENTDYAINVSPNNPVYTEKERIQFTLNLFIDNELWPAFDDDEITQIYKKIYFEKPKLLEQLQELQKQIESIQKVTLLSSEFDYTTLLAKYDVKAIDASIIKYFHAVQQWTGELIDKLDCYEQEKESVIRDFNLISLKLSKKYEDNPNLTKEENRLLSDRQRYFQKRISLGMNSAKSKILAVKRQADDLEYSIDEINTGNKAIRELALLEKEERASFSFIAEDTAEIVKNTLLKIEYFQKNHLFIMAAVNILGEWSENYRVFKTTYREDFKTACEDDSIEEEIWAQWYEDWQSIRFTIEQKIQPIIEYGLKYVIPTVTETKLSVPELLIDALDEYKCGIDKFFIEERKGIYQKFVFQTGGEVQEKFEVESELYKCTISLQSALQEIIFNCANAEDRIMILKWANSLLDIQIDGILEFVANNDLQKISKTILSEFTTLKQKNYDVYLSDAKAYSEEKLRREKEYNSLIFKMRKDLMKK